MLAGYVVLIFKTFGNNKFQQWAQNNFEVRCAKIVIHSHAMLIGITGLALGTFLTMFVNQDGSVWSTGLNSEARGKRFVQVMSRGATAAATGNYYSMVLKQDGSVWTTKNSKGQISFFDGLAASRRIFSIVSTMSNAKAVAAGGYHCMLLLQEGSVWTTGWNKYGQLGDGSTFDKTSFTLVIYSYSLYPAINSGPKALAVAVAAGDMHSIVLKEDGSVWTTGRNKNGQLGDGAKVDRNTFEKVMSSGAIGVVAGGSHSMVLKEDGSVWATGWNEYGQLGNGTTIDRTSYVQVVSSGAKTVAAGSRHSMMLKEDDSVWATGYNLYGQLGDTSTINRKFFTKVIAKGGKTIAAGAFHSMVLKKDGSIWATGSNKDGQFGDGSTTSTYTFIKLAPFGNGSCQSARSVLNLTITIHSIAGDTKEALAQGVN